MSEVKTMLSVLVTDNAKLYDIPISNNSQMIFVRDLRTIVLDYHGTRHFFNQIITINTEAEKGEIAPINGCYYFVKDSVVLYTYQDDNWIPLTQNSAGTIYIGIAKPSVGVNGILYVDTMNQDISVWDLNRQEYTIVGNVSQSITEAELLQLFNN